MRVLVFLQGTVLIEQNMVASTREESVRKSRERAKNASALGGLVPIGNSSAKLRRWKEKGAEILYFTASRLPENVRKSADALKQYGFPPGELFSRGAARSYAEVAEEISPDVIVEDDCESIGGEREMIYPNMAPAMKSKIKSVVVKEFEGIDHLPDDPGHLLWR